MAKIIYLVIRPCLLLLSSWDKHVISWTSNKWKVPLLIIKYEDLLNKKEETIRAIISFLNNYGFKFQNLDKKMINVLKSTSFQSLKSEESRDGFIEAKDGRQFFKSGTEMQWLNKLSTKQIFRIEDKFKTVMNRFNYKIS